MEVRNFSQGDAEELSDLVLSVYEESPIFTTYGTRPTKEDLLGLAGRKAYGLRSGYLVDLVMTHQGRVIANCELVRRGEGEAVIGIIIAKEHRRKGLGRRLVEKSVRGALAMGVHGIYAEINRQNKGAIFFFSKCGFKDQEVRGETKVMVMDLTDQLLHSSV
jgi:RimJ/RimL family protein N-acetyltransferase